MPVAPLVPDPDPASLEAVIDRFEAAHEGAPRPKIEDYLPDDERRFAVLVELVHSDLELRLRAGEPVGADDYLARFPELEADEDAAHSLRAREQELRSRQRVPEQAPADFGRFTLVEEIGRGGTGIVYRARDSVLGRDVALKVSWLAAGASERDARRFLREARHVARLRHPGIVPVYEAGQVAGMQYLASSFVEGTTLGAALARGRIERRRAVELLVAVARTLEYVHAQGTVHRDIKPSNILIDRDGRPLVADFGLARSGAEPTLTADGELLGTPGYMSPEQARGDLQAVDRRSDVFSVGVVLFELLTGARPFQGTVPLVLAQIADCDPPRPRGIDRSVPRDLEAVCLKAMARRPAERYQSAADLADDLQRWLDRRSVRARPAGPIKRLTRLARRRPAAAALAAALVLTLGAAGVELGRLWAKAQAHRAEVRRQQAQLVDLQTKERLRGDLVRTYSDRSKESVKVASELQNAVRARAETGPGLKPEELERALGAVRNVMYTLNQRPDRYRLRLVQSLIVTAQLAEDPEVVQWAMDRLEQEVADGTAQGDDPAIRAQIHGGVAKLMDERSSAEQAVLHYQQAVALWEVAARDRNDAGRSRLCLANQLRDFGEFLLRQDRPCEALRLLERAVALDQQSGGTPTDKDRARLAQALCNLGTAYDRLGRDDDSLRSFRRAAELYASLGDDGPIARYARPARAASLHVIGRKLTERGEFGPAVAALRESLRWRAALVADHPDEGRFRDDFDGTRERLDAALESLQRTSAAPTGDGDGAGTAPCG